MVLDHIANRSSLVVEPSSALHSEVLRHGNLHALNVSATPKGFGERVREAENQHVVHWPITEVVVNAEDVCFVEDPKKDFVKVLSFGQVMPEGLFDDDPRTF